MTPEVRQQRRETRYQAANPPRFPAWMIRVAERCGEAEYQRLLQVFDQRGDEMTEIEKIIEILQGERIAAEVKRMEAMAVAQQWADKMEEISRSVEYLKRSHPQQIKETELTTLKN